MTDDGVVAHDAFVALRNLARELVVEVDGEWGEGRTFEQLVETGEADAVVVNRASGLYAFDEPSVGLMVRVAQIAREGLEWTELNPESFEDLVKRGDPDAVAIHMLEQTITRTVG